MKKSNEISFVTFCILDYFRYIQKFKNDEELGADMRKFATALLFDDDSHDLAKDLLNEARAYRQKKSDAGKKGNEVRWKAKAKEEAKAVEPKQPKAPKVEIPKMGRYANVPLADSDYESLKQEIKDVDVCIEELSEYIASTGKKYKNFTATLRKWSSRRNEFIKKPVNQSFKDMERQRAAEIARAEFKDTMVKFNI